MAENNLQTVELLNNQLTHYLKFTYLYFLIRHKLHYRQVSVITHTDFDGFVSGAIILQKLPYARIFFAHPRTLHSALWVAGRTASPI